MIDKGEKAGGRKLKPEPRNKKQRPNMVNWGERIGKPTTMAPEGGMTDYAFGVTNSPALQK